MSTYKITNDYGQADGVWSREYESRADAAAAIRDALGWSDIVLSPSYQTDYGTGWSAYETQAECDADDTGAHAPMIERIEE